MWGNQAIHERIDSWIAKKSLLRNLQPRYATTKVQGLF